MLVNLLDCQSMMLLWRKGCGFWRRFTSNWRTYWIRCIQLIISENGTGAVPRSFITGGTTLQGVHASLYEKLCDGMLHPYWSSLSSNVGRRRSSFRGYGSASCAHIKKPGPARSPDVAFMGLPGCLPSLMHNAVYSVCGAANRVCWHESRKLEGIRFCVY